MEEVTTGIEPRAEGFRSLLYFQLRRPPGEPRGEELWVFVGPRIHRWWVPGGMQSATGLKHLAIEEPTLPASTRRDGAFWDDGFCRVGDLDERAVPRFREAVEEGRVELELLGVRRWGPYVLRRTHQSPGEGAHWLIWRAERAASVA